MMEMQHSEFAPTIEVFSLFHFKEYAKAFCRALGIRTVS